MLHRTLLPCLCLALPLAGCVSNSEETVETDPDGDPLVRLGVSTLASQLKLGTQCLAGGDAGLSLVDCQSSWTATTGTRWAVARPTDSQQDVVLRNLDSDRCVVNVEGALALDECVPSEPAQRFSLVVGEGRLEDLLSLVDGTSVVDAMGAQPLNVTTLAEQPEPAELCDSQGLWGCIVVSGDGWRGGRPGTEIEIRGARELSEDGQPTDLAAVGLQLAVDGECLVVDVNGVVSHAPCEPVDTTVDQRLMWRFGWERFSYDLYRGAASNSGPRYHFLLLDANSLSSETLQPMVGGVPNRDPDAFRWQIKF